MEEDGLSLLDMWRLILKKKILGMIVFGMVTIISLALILFVYNPLSVKYEVTFNYKWQGIENNKYANGSVFNFYDIISLENLKKVKDKDEIYQSINVEELSEDIRIEVEEMNYRIKASGKYFSNDKQAKLFLEDLIYLPYQKALNLNFDFKANLVGYERSKKIATKLEYLENQITMILEGYQSMISYFGDIEIDNTNLSSLYRRVEVFASNNEIKNYRYIAYQNYFMTKEEYASIMNEQDALKTEQSLLRERKLVLLDSLRNIYTNSNGNTYMDTSIANYLNSLHTLDSRLIAIDESLRLIQGAVEGKYNEAESLAFLNQLDEYKEELESLTLEYTESVNQVLRENTLLNVEPIQATGGIRVILAIPISVFLGIIAGLCIAFILAYIKKDKTQKETEPF